MSKTDHDYLCDIREYLDKARNFTKGGKDAFYNDEMVQLAVIRVYEVIGEIVKRLPDTIRTSHPEINWRQLAGFRDFLAHNYEEIILGFVWQAIEDIEDLDKKIETVIETISSDEEDNDV